jgi:hypothetical protein
LGKISKKTVILLHQDLSPDLSLMYNMLQLQIAKENWSQKRAFIIEKLRTNGRGVCRWMLRPTKVESWPHVEQTGESPAVLKAPQAADHLAELIYTCVNLKFTTRL